MSDYTDFVEACCRSSFTEYAEAQLELDELRQWKQKYETTGYSFTLQKKEKPTDYEYIHNWVYDTYEEAVDVAIRWSLENLI